jgi:hypothetical protein
MRPNQARRLGEFEPGKKLRKPIGILVRSSVASPSSPLPLLQGHPSRARSGSVTVRKQAGKRFVSLCSFGFDFGVLASAVPDAALAFRLSLVPTCPHRCFPSLCKTQICNVSTRYMCSYIPSETCGRRQTVSRVSLRCQSLLVCVLMTSDCMSVQDMIGRPQAGKIRKRPHVSQVILAPHLDRGRRLARSSKLVSRQSADGKKIRIPCWLVLLGCPSVGSGKALDWILASRLCSVWLVRHKHSTRSARVGGHLAAWS